ncbi:MAG: GDP-L-fucose synthase [Lachnospiraceae bacterium]|jgi:GDP-L-fucose synthase|nr:GDP-L-fucose synthase [Lachnospiraceae bacterium]
MNSINTSHKIYVAGHRGLVGSAICRNLMAKGYDNLVCRTHGELDLLDQAAVSEFMAAEKPDAVVLAAARVGGINANNTRPAEFAYENLQIELNIIHAAHLNNVKKLLFLGSTCIYPRLAPQPIPETALLTGPLEETNEAYAIAKIAGLKLCQYYKRQYGDNFISCMPTNLYGPHDNFDLEGSHVLPAMLRKFHEAKVGKKPVVELWGSGTPLREFLYVDDMADACIFLLENYDGEEHVNIGSGEEVSIKELAEIVRKAVGYEGEIVWNSAMPDGTPRKLTNVEKLHALGWRHRVGLTDGVKMTYQWYQEEVDKRK